MRRLMVLVCGVVVCAASVALHSQADPSAAVVYEGARLIVGDGSAAIDNSAFVVQNGLIIALGQKGAVTAPAGSGHIDLTGKTVMPTLINVHLHPGYEGSPQNLYSAWNPENWTPQNTIVHLQREAFYGIGAVLSAGGDQLDRASKFAEDQVDGNLGAAARFYYAAGIETPAGGPDAMLMKANKLLTTLHKAGSAAEARATVQQLADLKITHVKVWIDRRGDAYAKLTPEMTAIYAAIYDEAHKHQMTVHTHATLLADQKAAVKGGTDVLVHTSTEPLDDEFVALLKDRKPYWVPVDGVGADPVAVCADPFVTQGVLPSALSATSDPLTGTIGANGCDAAPASAAANEEKFLAQFRKMVDAGARPVLGTDAGLGRYMYGWSEHYVLARYVKGGLTPAQAIQAATQRGAELLGLKDTGTLTTGKRADFVVLNADPLTDIKNTREIASVYLRGVKLEREDLLKEWSRTKARRR
jgi:imidazolonepropionase-like amidohydrolase